MLGNFSLTRLMSLKTLRLLAGATTMGFVSLGTVPSEASSLSAAPGVAGFFATKNVAVGDDLLVNVGHRGYRYGHRGYYDDRFTYRHPYGRRGYRNYRHDPGAAVAAGIFGLAAGAIISGALAPQPMYNVPPQPFYGVPARPVYRVAPRAVHRAAPRPGDRLIGRYSASDLTYCSRKYRSFDPASFTFLGYDGRRHYCRIP